MKANPVTWFEIHVKDMSRAKAFYEKTLATRLEKLDTPAPDIDEMLTFPTGDQHHYGSSGALVKMNGGPVGGAGTLVYFECDDCAVEAARVRPNGGKVMKEKFAIGKHGFIAIATDTEGNGFGLHSMK